MFGDIGTSPLYALKSRFSASGADPSKSGDVLGIASLLIWTLAAVLTSKYVTFIMRVEHDGEGGILALLARAVPPTSNGAPVKFGFVTAIVVVGAAMLLGDGPITRAISVGSAIEGLDVANANGMSRLRIGLHSPTKQCGGTTARIDESLYF